MLATENDTWECYLCTAELSFEENPKGYLANYHPLCLNCANEVLQDTNHRHRSRLTFHERVGDLNMAGDIPVEVGYVKCN